MHIHRIENGETVKDVARVYGIDEEILRMNNGLDGIEPTVGEELAVLIPTRSYTVARTDTLERLALRFGIRESELVTHNPWIGRGGLVPGRRIALRYGERSHGIAPSNAYVYRGCREEQLCEVLPYLTYVTFCAAADDGTRLVETMRCASTVRKIAAEGRIPLVRIYDRAVERSHGTNSTSEYIDRMIAYATRSGYKGIVLGGGKYRTEEEYSAFLVEMRKRMIGCDLILVTEMNESTYGGANEYADASVLDCISADEYSCDGVRRALEDFATRLESSKTLVSLPTYAHCGTRFKEIGALLHEARRRGGKVEVDGERGIAHLHMHGEIWSYPSLESTKAILDAVGEYGFMGVSFDCMRVPRAHLSMYNAAYKSALMPSVSSHPKCNPNG